MQKQNLIIAALSVLPLSIVACGQTPLETDFGNSVRNVVQQQIYDTEAALNPDKNAVEGGDPYRLNESVAVHQTDVSKPAEVNNDININVGN